MTQHPKGEEAATPAETMQCTNPAGCGCENGSRPCPNGDPLCPVAPHPVEPAQAAEGAPFAWVNYPVKVVAGEFSGHGEPELSRERKAYGYDWNKAEPLYLASRGAAQPEPPSAEPLALCSDCPPHGYPSDKTRCACCPRRTAIKNAAGA